MAGPPFQRQSDVRALLVDENGTPAVISVDVGEITVPSKDEDSAFQDGDDGIPAMAVRTDSPANKSGTNGDYEPIQIKDGLLWVRAKGMHTPNGDSMVDDTNDALNVNVVAGGGGGTADGSTYTPDTTEGIPIMGAFDDASPAAATEGDVGIVRMTEDRALHVHVASSTSTPTQLDDAAFTPATGPVAMVGFFADETATDSVGEGDGGAARMTLDRKQIETLYAHTAGGVDTFHSNDLDETEEDVKTSAGQVYGWFITNRTAAPAYVHFYNATAANVTVGTTAPLFNLAIPGNASDYVAAQMMNPMGITFSTAISVAATTDFPDDGSAAGPAANGVVCTVWYK